ncbi:MAG: biopolymer transporter ExbD [Verrucomicrobiota bacterium]
MKLRHQIRPLHQTIDMTALIDVVLLLLIFFILSSSFVLQPGIEINPPRGLHTGVRESRHIVTMTHDPALIFYNDRVIEAEDLVEEFYTVAHETDDISLIIRADERVSHGEVVEIMNQAIQAGLTVIIATKPEEE